MLSITQRDYRNALCVSANTVTSRLRGVDHSSFGSVRRYGLTSVLPTVKDRERSHADALFDLAVGDADDLFVGDDPLARANALSEWLDEPSRARLRQAQSKFVVALANSRLCAAPIMENIDPLRRIMVLSPAVYGPVIFGRGELPVMREWSPAFAIVNNTYFPQMELEAL